MAGTYTIAADGTNLLQLSAMRNYGLLDISADGTKVVWYDEYRDGYVAGRDGSGKVKLPGTHAVSGLRMTAAGDQIYEVAPEAGGIIKLPANGSGMTLVKATADVATLNGVDANGNHWRGVIDISDDGSKVVFTFLWDVFSMAGDGGGLKQHTQFLMPENRTLKLARVSGNGAKMAWNVEDGARSAVTIADWGGSNKLDYVGLNYASGAWLRLSGDASRAALGWGIRLLDTTKAVALRRPRLRQQLDSAGKAGDGHPDPRCQAGLPGGGGTRIDRSGTPAPDRGGGLRSAHHQRRPGHRRNGYQHAPRPQRRLEAGVDLCAGHGRGPDRGAHHGPARRLPTVDSPHAVDELGSQRHRRERRRHRQ